MSKRHFVVFLSLLLSLVGCQGMAQNQKNADGHVNTTVSVDEFSQKLGTLKNVQLVDVRTPGEYAEGHLANSMNIDIHSSDFESKVSKLDKNAPVMVYCRSGARSSNAASKMESMGFKEVYNMDGGIMSWSGAGKPVKQ